MVDDSWDKEMAECLEAVYLGRALAVGLSDASAVLELVDAVYRASGHDYRS